MTSMDRDFVEPRPNSPWREWWAERAHQAWLNLRIWAPGLANPNLRARDVVVWAREARSGARWEVELPEQCWRCGKREGLRRRSARDEARGFEYPLTIGALTLATAAIWLLWLYLFPAWLPAILFLATLGLGAAALALKSWTDEVSLGVWHCGEHEGLPKVEYVLEEDQLHVILPSEALAEALAAQLQQRRRSRGAYRDDDAPEPRNSASHIGHREHPLPGSFHRTTPDLPPIELADGPEDTPPAGDEPTGA